MSFAFKVENVDPVKAEAKIQAYATANHGAFDPELKTFSGEGVAGFYGVEGTTILITITDKPRLVPKAFIKSVISEFLTS